MVFRQNRQGSLQSWNDRSQGQGQRLHAVVGAQPFSPLESRTQTRNPEGNHPGDSITTKFQHYGLFADGLCL